MDEKRISVIISSYNRANYIIQAIDSLYQQTIPHNEYEVIVVDNNSIDDTKSLCLAYIAAHPDLKVIYAEEKQQGSSFARNRGAALATAPLITFIDDDAVAFPDFLERILAFFDAHPEASGLGGRIIPKYIPEEPAWMSRFVASMVANMDYSDHVTEFSKNRYPFEPNMTVWKKDFFEVNGFDTTILGVIGKMRISGEGKDFFFKLKKTGKRIFYDPTVKVYHVVEVSKLTRKYMGGVAEGMGRGERVRTKKIGQGAYLAKVAEYIYKLGGATALGAWYALKGTPAKTWPIIRFRIDALRGLLQPFNV